MKVNSLSSRSLILKRIITKVLPKKLICRRSDKVVIRKSD